MQNGGENSLDGLSSDSSTDSQDLSPPSLLQIMERLTLAMEQQNQALFSLVEQTATLIALVMQNAEEQDQDDATYLDGTPRAL